MVILTQTNDSIIVGAQGTLTIFMKNDLTQINVEIPEINLPSNLTKSQEETIKSATKTITCICCCPEFVAVSAENKQVVLFDRNFKVTRNFISNRAVSKMCFTSNNDLLLADKTGDVTLYKLQSGECEIILGHLSMLLDVKLSDCGRFVVTCDRDEKIRISHFPNAYNIESYCLGHKEFVVNVAVCGDLLISASGDGTIRFWNLNGVELNLIDTNQYVEDKSLLEKFCKEIDREEINALPIREMQVYNCDDVIIVAVVLMCFKGILLYKVKVNGCKVETEYLTHLNCDVLAFSLNRDLFVLTRNELLQFQLKQNDFVVVKAVKNLQFCSLKFNDVSVLYKRKFDNVQEYLERKKIRLEGKQ